jgi:hypothetical protein
MDEREMLCEDEFGAVLCTLVSFGVDSVAPRLRVKQDVRFVQTEGTYQRPPAQ